MSVNDRGQPLYVIFQFAAMGKIVFRNRNLWTYNTKAWFFSYAADSSFVLRAFLAQLAEAAEDPSNVTLTCLLGVRFYIGCDRCQDWFHGTCVGVTQVEADQLEIYVCPRCSETETKAERHQLKGKDYDTLKRLLRSLQVCLRKIQL